MGSDNLHHKRTKRSVNSFKREISKRATYDYVLIVCEGIKTEPYYLKAFRDDRKLSSANIEVIGLGADPLKIVDHALKEFNKTKDYNKIFCVFDKDQHATYQSALNKIEALRNRNKKPIPIYAITSVPCFEYWILLHFVDTARPYNRTEHKSPGDLLLSEIKSHLKDYHKGHKDIFQIIKPNLHIALARAKKHHALQKENGTDNPSTNIYELIEYLDQIKKTNN